MPFLRYIRMLRKSKLSVVFLFTNVHLHCSAASYFLFIRFSDTCRCSLTAASAQQQKHKKLLSAIHASASSKRKRRQQPSVLMQAKGDFNVGLSRQQESTSFIFFFTGIELPRPRMLRFSSISIQQRSRHGSADSSAASDVA